MLDLVWELAAGRRLVAAPWLVMGVVNVTPDSFHDGGRHDDTAAAVRHALSLAQQGAHILDVGGESTRPGADPVDAATEAERVLPVIQAVIQAVAETMDSDSSVVAARGPRETPTAAKAAGAPRHDAQTDAAVISPGGAGAAVISPGGASAAVISPGGAGAAVISVDTYKASVAAQALEAGASIINDVSACAWDPALQEVLATYTPGYVLMHAQGRPGVMQHAPRYANVVDEVRRFLEDRLAMLVKAGVPESRVALDPGVGFGKSLAHNLALLANLEVFTTLGRPVLVGLSYKSLWEKLLGLPVAERGEATQVATALAASKGARIHRVHDVARTVRTLRVATAFAECAAVSESV